MSNIFKDSEFLGKSNEKKWSQIGTFQFGSGLKLRRKKKFFFADFALHTLPNGLETSGCIANFGISLDMFEFFAFLVISSVFQKKIRFLGILSPPGNHASRWIKDLWWKGVSLILAYFQTFLSFCVLDDFFLFFKNLGFWVFLVHPTVVLVLLCGIFI